MGGAQGKWPYFDAGDLEAVNEVLTSGRVNYWTGEQGKQFEAEFAEFCGVSDAVWLANGTLALEAALQALQLPPGSEVITTPRSFFATVTSIVRSDLVPVFADVDIETGNITPETCAAVLSDRTSAIVVVHLGGWPADLAGLKKLADQRGLALIEDCAQAHGARLQGRSVGGFGDIAAWSFCQDKIISTGGEGGMVTTNSATLADRVWSLKDHGKDRGEVNRTDHPPGFRWLHTGIGSNWRGTEVSAAIGRRQLARLPEWSAQRAINALAIAKRLAPVPAVRVPLPPEDITHAYYRQYVLLDLNQLGDGWDKQRIMAEVGRRGGTILSGSCSEMYREKGYSQLPGARTPQTPAAKHLEEASLTFLVHPTMSESTAEQNAAILADVMQEATR